MSAERQEWTCLWAHETISRDSICRFETERHWRGSFLPAYIRTHTKGVFVALKTYTNTAWNWFISLPSVGLSPPLSQNLTLDLTKIIHLKGPAKMWYGQWKVTVVLTASGSGDCSPSFPWWTLGGLTCLTTDNGTVLVCMSKISNWTGDVA